MNQPFPFLKIIIAAVYFAWTYRAEFLRAISIPTLIMATLWGGWVLFSEKLAWGFSWGIALLYGLGFAFLAVTCHRLVLLGSGDRFRPLAAKPAYRELKFLGWLLLVYGMKAAVTALVWTSAREGGGRLLASGGDGVLHWVKELASIPGLYLVARLSLVFPATAVDRRGGLRWSWLRTRGNGWRIFMAVAAFPLAVGMLFDFLTADVEAVAAQVVLFMVTCVGIGIEVIVLSLTYRELALQYAASATEAGAGHASLDEAAVAAFHAVPASARARKWALWSGLAAGLLLTYGLLGTLMSHISDCSSTVLSSASSPGGAYQASLLSQTCRKDSPQQGLVLEIVKTGDPDRHYEYPLSRTVPATVELVWNSERSMIVKYAGSFDTSGAPPVLLDDLRLVFQPR